MQTYIGISEGDQRMTFNGIEFIEKGMGLDIREKSFRPS